MHVLSWYISEGDTETYENGIPLKYKDENFLGLESIDLVDEDGGYVPVNIDTLFYCDDAGAECQDYHRSAHANSNTLLHSKHNRKVPYTHRRNRNTYGKSACHAPRLRQTQDARFARKNLRGHYGATTRTDNPVVSGRVCLDPLPSTTCMYKAALKAKKHPPGLELLDFMNGMQGHLSNVLPSLENQTLTAQAWDVKDANPVPEQTEVHESKTRKERQTIPVAQTHPSPTMNVAIHHDTSPHKKLGICQRTNVNQFDLQSELSTAVQWLQSQSCENGYYSIGNSIF